MGIYVPGSDVLGNAVQSGPMSQAEYQLLFQWNAASREQRQNIRNFLLAQAAKNSRNK